MKKALAATAVLIALGTLACARNQTAPEPTAADAKAFLDNVNQTMLKLGVEAGQAGWEELRRTMARLESADGKGKWCSDPKDPGTCLNVDDVTKVMAESRDAR